MGFPQKISTTSKIVTASLLVLVMFGQSFRSHTGSAAAAPIAPRGHRGFGISGTVGRLYPGKRTVFAVRVRNFTRFALSLRHITAAVRRPGPHCAAGNIRITPFNGRRRIGAGRSIRVGLHILMKKTAPNGCQGITFPVMYRGKAVRV